VIAPSPAAAAPLDAYAAFCAPLVEGGLLTDPWCEGEPRFDTAPVLLTRGLQRRLYTAAESLAAAFDEGVRLCAASPGLLDDFFCLTPFQKLMWASSAPLWHGFARFDLFETAEGIRACELNCDTPTGQPEAVLLSQRVQAAHPLALDPNAGLEEAFLATIDALSGPLLAAAPAVGIVYPTELTEDLPLIRLYTHWLEGAGLEVVLGSPFNLQPTGDGGVSLFGVPCALLLRHYKTDWWGEREPVWKDDEPYPDGGALEGPLGVVLAAALNGRVSVVNPFGAVVGHNKKLMALLWEELGRLSPASQEAVRAHLPLTLRLEAVSREQLVAEREEWVLKSDYGCEGAEVVLGRDAGPDEWEKCLTLAAPGRWVVQRRFDPLVRADAAGEERSVNYGVYLYGGRASGLYCRTQPGRSATDAGSRSAPCLVVPQEER
jgi:Glutathionylspermidine synthase preATP-grasp